MNVSADFIDWRPEAGDASLSGMAPPVPDRPVYIIGDIHGCREKLNGLLEAIDRDAEGVEADIVFLGDYVDRGPDSAGVLADLRRLEAKGAGRVICLAGNHDRMMLDFLDAPNALTGRWLSVGGVETLASFGVPVDPLVANHRIAEALAEAMGPGLVEWLRNRPLWWQSGNVVAVHALTDPVLPMESQDEHTLLWARPGARLEPRHDGAWVVHGHTMVPRPTVRSAHIAVDTGACRGNPLTAAALAKGGLRFLQVR